MIGAGGSLLAVAISTLSIWLICKCCKRKVKILPLGENGPTGTETSGLIEPKEVTPAPYSIVKRDFTTAKRTLTEEETKPPLSSNEGSNSDVKSPNINNRGRSQVVQQKI